MPLVGQTVPDGDARELGQRLDRGLGKAPVLDAVVDAAQHPGRVLHRLFVADVRTAGAQVGDVRALIVGGDLERDAGAG